MANRRRGGRALSELSADARGLEAPESPFEHRSRLDAGKQAKGRSRAEYLGQFTSIGGALATVLMSANAGARYGGSGGKTFGDVLRVLSKRLAGTLRIGPDDAFAIEFGDNSTVHAVRLGSGDVVLVPAHYLDDERPSRKRLLDLLSAGPVGKLRKVGSARITGDAAILLWAPATAQELDDRAIGRLSRAPREIDDGVGLAFALESGRYVLWCEAPCGADVGYRSCYWLTSSKRAPKAARLPPVKDGAVRGPLGDRARIDAGKQAKARSRAHYLGQFSGVEWFQAVLTSAAAGAKYGASESTYNTLVRSLVKKIVAPLRIGTHDAIGILFGNNPTVHVVRLGSGDVVLVPSHYLQSETPDRKRLLDLLSAGPVGELAEVGSARIKGNAAVLLWSAATAEDLDDRAIHSLARAPRELREKVVGVMRRVGVAFALKSGKYSLWREGSSDGSREFANCFWLTPSKRAPS